MNKKRPAAAVKIALTDEDLKDPAVKAATIALIRALESSGDDAPKGESEYGEPQAGWFLGSHRRPDGSNCPYSASPGTVCQKCGTSVPKGESEGSEG